jgi:hypothetical protein
VRVPGPDLGGRDGQRLPRLYPPAPSKGQPGEKFGRRWVNGEFSRKQNGTPMEFGEMDRATSFPVRVAEIQAVETGDAQPRWESDSATTAERR